MQYNDTVERWGIFELRLKSRDDDRLFADAELHALFNIGERQCESFGFYDGNGWLCIRFMPDEEGEWSFTLSGSEAPMGGYTGQFQCLAAKTDNHGPVHVAGTTHFVYADGTSFTPFGTQLLAWHMQESELRTRTLQTLQASPFNKARMSLLPMSEYKAVDEISASPFATSTDGQPDYDCYNPAYFARLEESVTDLDQLGVEAELILFPGNSTGEVTFQLTSEQEERYIRYVVSRFAAYRNVWWSMADVGDGSQRPDHDYRQAFRTLRECDYGHHLCTIHGTPSSYNCGAPWLTHISLRHEEPTICSSIILQYEKPVIIDHGGREGNGPERENALTAEELLRRIWEGMTRGGYVTHGEYLYTPQHTCWSIHGGELLGESVQRIMFMRNLLADAPGFLTYNRMRHDVSTIERQGEYYLPYFGGHRCTSRMFAVPSGEFSVDLIDTWNMTIDRLDQTYQDRFEIMLPGELYYALRLQKTNDAEVIASTNEEERVPVLAVDDGD
ncbi:DUF5605 domain-containing protein [Paenibacillus sp. FSL R10-2734]|uniref:DUF5605 domain-containing protein n=1 Tax=Paenibacillus sp. FSL R10-2734 TaxID=2954691 RepID=UPI0030DD879F